ncbi:hypothetical protein Tco_0673905 [Tanacetum coccineum]
MATQQESKGKEIVQTITPLSESASERRHQQQPQNIPQTPETKCGYLLQGTLNDNHTGQFLGIKGSEFVRSLGKHQNALKTPHITSKRSLLLNMLRMVVKLSSRDNLNWLADTDEEIDEQELEAHYSYMAKIQEVPNADSGTDAEPLEQVQYDTDDNVFANDIQHFDQSESISKHMMNQNDVECWMMSDCTCNLIANLKLDVDENKKIQKQLKKANATLTQELTECKSILAETSRTLGESNSIRDRVAHKTNVCRPQPRSNQMKDKVVSNNSQVKDKKTEVEDHPRISSISNKTKSVTACNDSLKSRTLNVNAVCATCGKCVFNSNHDACVSKLLNDVNARTKKPKVVPISTKQPKSQANKFVATPLKKIVASKSTIKKSKSYYRMLYEKTSKAWKWWDRTTMPIRI